MVPCDTKATQRLKEMPANWTLEHDEDLASFLSGHVEVDSESLGSIKNYVESIDVSSFCVRHVLRHVACCCVLLRRVTHT